MRVIALRRLEDHWQRPGRGDSEQPQKSWYALMKEADWAHFAQVKRSFVRQAQLASASSLTSRQQIPGREALMGARSGTADGDRLDILATLIEAYEAEHHAIDAPYPVALIEFVMEQRGLDRADIGKFIGSRGRESEALSKRRALSLPMIRKLHVELGLPAAVLVRPYRLRKPRAA